MTEKDLAAEDRKALAKRQPVKTSRWPRTERRQERVAAVLRRRQPDLTLVLEDVHDPHNVSAMLRTCDAVGIGTIHLVYTNEIVPEEGFARTTSAGAAKWVATERHASIAACYAVLRAQGLRIVATALAPTSQDLYATNLRAPIALVFGNEMRGVSADALAAADGSLIIPMMGMVESLNVSVACAVTLFEALRQRRAAGDYAQPKLDQDTLLTRTEEWLNR